MWTWGFFRRGLKGNVLVSYPKSGRTWVRFALTVAEAPVRYNHGGYASRDPDDLGYRFTGVRPAFFGERTAFLHRNPIDTAVSEFHQIHNRIFTPSHPHYDRMRDRLSALDLLPPSDIDAFVLHPVWGCRKVSAFNRAHIDHFFRRHNATIVTYEDLRSDPATQFAALLDFFGVKGYDIDAVVRESSFDNMRRIELSADPDTKKKHALYGVRDNNENSLKVRRGKVHGYLDALSPDTVALARRICSEYGL